MQDVRNIVSGLIYDNSNTLKVIALVHMKVYPKGSVASNGTFIATGNAVHTGQLFFDNATLNAVAVTCKFGFKVC